jgi:ribonuclease Y
MAISTVIAALVAVVVAVIAAVGGTFYGINKQKQADAATIGDAETKARVIIDDALKAAEATKREASLALKEENIKAKNEFEKETKERRAELQRYEKRVLGKEEAIERKADSLDRKEASLASRESNLNKQKAEVEKLQSKHLQELERISGLTSEQAKEYLLTMVEDDVKHETAVMIKEMTTKAKEEASKKAKEYVVTAIQKCAADHVAETTISLVQLPNDEMKGRIIGREGRNIRTLETMTGVDLIIDDTPEAVILSSFDPVRREIARIALEKLIVDGRIHPARIEEMVEKATKEVEVMMKEEGEAATLEVGVHGIHPELVRLLGKMKFRTSYGQNALKHSIEVAHLSGLLAAEIGVDIRVAKRAGLLHDIGKSIDHEIEGSHIQIGVDLCRRYKESPIVINAVEAHHGDVEPQSLIACIVQAADTISAARPGARRETLESYTTRLKQLEDIANGHKGVDKTFAIQAGREIRVMVVPEQVSDSDMVILSRDISKQIEAELEYPGQIKVNVIRESRVTSYAK